MSTLLAIIAGAVSLLAFFHDRNSDTGTGKILSIGVLIAIILSTGLGSYLAWSNTRALIEANATEEQVRQEVRLGQTLLAMQALRLGDPFDHATISFSTRDQEMSDTQLLRPYGNLHRGIVVEGPGQFALIDLEVRDLWSYSLDYETNDAGEIRAVQGRRDGELYPQLSSDLMGSEIECLTQGNCDERPFLWWEEHLASADGQFHQGFNLPDIDEHPAALYLSLVTEARELGTIRIRRPETAWWQPSWWAERNFRTMISDELRASILFIQDGEISSVSGQCRNRVEFPLRIKAYDNEPPWRVGCAENEMCFVVTHDQNPRISFCESSQI